MNRSAAPKLIGLYLLAVALVLLAACGSKEATGMLRGLVTDVQARSIDEVATLTVVDESTGKAWTFSTDGPVGFTPSHVREHMLQGQPVNVHYQKRDGRLVAVRITD